MTLPRAPAPTVTGEHVQELVELSLLLGGLSARDGVRHARFDVRAKDGLGRLCERRFRRSELEENVDAIPVFLDHARDPVHLARDTPEAREDLVFGRSV
jgi:hypothetical protein